MKEPDQKQSFTSKPLVPTRIRIIPQSPAQEAIRRQQKLLQKALQGSNATAESKNPDAPAAALGHGLFGEGRYNAPGKLTGTAKSLQPHSLPTRVGRNPLWQKKLRSLDGNIDLGQLAERSKQRSIPQKSVAEAATELQAGLEQLYQKSSSVDEETLRELTEQQNQIHRYAIAEIESQALVEQQKTAAEQQQSALAVQLFLHMEKTNSMLCEMKTELILQQEEAARRDLQNKKQSQRHLICGIAASILVGIAGLFAGQLWF